MEKFNIRPVEGSRSNKVAATLHTLAIVTWVSGVTLGVYIGNKLGEVQSYFGRSEFAWNYAFIIWGATFVSGLIPYAFSEIIYLLQGLNNKSYYIEYTEETFLSKNKDKDEKRDASNMEKTAAIKEKQDYQAVDEDVDSFLNRLAGMTSAVEIKKYVDYLASQGSSLVTEELLKITEDSSIVERSYGNQYKNCMKKICIFYGYKYENTPVESKPVTEESQETNGDIEQGDPDGVFCTNCGNRIDEADAIFCPVCGNKIIWR